VNRLAFALLGTALLLGGCANSISKERLATADYGPPPPAGYQEMIKARFAGILIDPTSPLYEFEQPAKGYTKKSSMFNTSENFGWRVCGTVNSKNRFGGYAGRVPFFVLFRHGQIVATLVGNSSAGGNTLDLQNAAIIGACRRTV